MKITIETEDRSFFYTTETLRGNAWCNNCHKLMTPGNDCFLNAAAQKGYCSLKCIEEYHKKPKKILEGVNSEISKHLEPVIEALDSTAFGMSDDIYPVTESLKKDTDAWRYLLKLLKGIRDGKHTIHTVNAKEKEKFKEPEPKSAKPLEMKEKKEVFCSAYPVEAINKTEMKELIENLRKWYEGESSYSYKFNLNKLFRLTDNLWSSFFAISTEAESQRREVTRLKGENVQLNNTLVAYRNWGMCKLKEHEGKRWERYEDCHQHMHKLIMAPNITLMTENEVMTRLAAGEDSIELSIEKWERIVNYLKQKPSDLAELGRTAGGGSCALCRESAGGFSGPNNCWNCPYFLYHGESCTGEYPTPGPSDMCFDYPPPSPGSWTRFDYLLRDSMQHHTITHALIKSAEVMRDKLIELRVMK